MNRTRRDVILGASSVVVLTAALGDWRLGPGAPLSEPAEDLPAPAADVPFIAPRYLDRAAVARQTVALPGLVQSILSPAFGAPARVDGQFRFPIILAEPAPSARFFLVSRDDLAEIDSDLYALPPLPGGETLMRERLRQAFTAEPGAAVGNILPAPVGSRSGKDAATQPAMAKRGRASVEADRRGQRRRRAGGRRQGPI